MFMNFVRKHMVFPLFSKRYKVLLYTNFCIIILFNFLMGCTNSENVTITAVGDVYFTKKYPDNLNSIKLSGDICIGNLEGFIDSLYNENDIKQNILSMPEVILDVLKEIGFNAFSQANNHSLDKGWTTCNQSKEILKKHKFYVAGTDDKGFVFEKKQWFKSKGDRMFI